ncbi:MAG TPA: histidine kinase [Leptospiraceae bacterium]|nr:histidine kinase [Leptospiraceae bacterium]HMX33322.1 histidine kinase [Leptospiraceae bacterium]HMY32077.1 histidine kinase [Leptospiraceae bacterium]HMZ64000.1 histidine kinase [Leptospiraceae bacterium]HNB98761.1 histidine kinase [Leptospiraceae bacterium]
MQINQLDSQYDMEFIQQNANEIQIKTYRTSRHLEERVQETLQGILTKFEKERLIPILYTVIKELIINATKANQKRVFFEENHFDIKNPEHYAIGIKEYKKIFSENMGQAYAPKCKAKDYYCLIIFDYDASGLKIEIRNNTLIAEQEEKSIREKLATAMSYDDLAQFYMDNADNTEGAGLGLALIIIMMKGEGIDPNYFRISITNEYTSARLEIPFTNEYKSARN